jgi:hypothetical protein
MCRNRRFTTRLSVSRFAVTALGMLALAAMMVHGTVVAASPPNLAASSAPCAAQSSDGSVQRGWTCIFDARCCPAAANDRDGPEKSSGEAKISPETETVLKVAEGTLQGVRVHADFLAALWSWTTIAAIILGATFTVLGITSIKDLRKARKKAIKAAKLAKRSKIEAQTNFENLSTEIKSNFIVNMNYLFVQPGVNDIESQRAKLGVAAATDAVFKQRESATYADVVKRLSDVLDRHPPTDPAVASYAYDLLGYAQYRLGHVSAALEFVKKSLEFKKNNATALYNAASYAARIRLLDQSLGFLERAIERDQDSARSAKTDEDFEPLRALPKFIALVGP